MLSIKRNLIYMPASLKQISGSLVFVLIIFLVGCSRDNSLSIPEEYVASEKLDCDVEIPFTQLITNVEITNIQDVLDFNFGEFEYESKVDFFKGSVQLSPTLIDINYFNDPDNHLLTEGIHSLNSVAAKVNGTFLDSPTSNFRLNLVEPLSELKVEVSGTFSFFVSRQVGEACEHQFEVDTLGNKTTTKLTETKSVNYVYTFSIERSNLDDLSANILELDETERAVSDEFGRSVSLGKLVDASGAKLGLAVGVYHDDAIADDSGAVYIYEQVAKGQWQEMTSIKASNAEAGDLFGYSVSMSDSFLAVSAPGEDSSYEGVFSWVDQEGNVDENNDPIGDGENDNQFVEVSNLAESSGAVYLFKLDENEPNGWKQVAYIKPPSNSLSVDGYNDGFGTKVMVRGEVLLISAPKEDSLNGGGNDISRPNSGAVFVYQYDSGKDKWEFSTTLKASDAGAGDAFGSAITMHDSIIAVGAPGESSSRTSPVSGEANINDLPFDDSSEKSGAVYLFKSSGSAWELSSYLKVSNNDEGDAFGSSLTMNALRIFVGASREDSNGTYLNRNKTNNGVSNSGAVYGFYKASVDNWVEYVYIKADTPKKGAQFGSQISLNNDNLIVGSPLYPNLDSLGRVYWYKSIGNTIHDVHIISEDSGQPDSRLGNAISMLDGVLAVGANGFTNIAQHSGKVAIWQ